MNLWRLWFDDEVSEELKNIREIKSDRITWGVKKTLVVSR